MDRGDYFSGFLGAVHWFWVEIARAAIDVFGGGEGMRESDWNCFLLLKTRGLGSVQKRRSLDSVGRTGARPEIGWKDLERDRK